MPGLHPPADPSKLARMARLRPWLVLLLLVACREPPLVVSQPPPQPAAAVPPSPTPHLAAATTETSQPAPPPLARDEQLRAEVGLGGTVLLDLREDGLWAKSLDGARRQQIAEVTATWLWVDAQTRVLWLWREEGGELRALDLAVPLPEVVTVATGVPTGLAWLWPKRPVVGPDDAKLRLAFEPGDVGFQYSLPPEPGRWTAPRRWRTCGHAKKRQTEPACPTLAPGTDAFLRILAARAAAQPVPPLLGRASAPPQGCPSQACGAARTLGVTHWSLVPAAVWSDCCRRGHQLYDARARRFLRLGTGKLLPRPSGDRRDTVEFLWLCPQGDAVVTESGVVPLEPPGSLRFGDADACLGGQPVRTPSLPCPQGDQCEDDAGENATGEAPL